MDLRSEAAAALPQYEPFIERWFPARAWLKAAAVDTDDVRQECRMRAFSALLSVRTHKPHLKDTPDEVRIVNRAIARQYVDLQRQAHAGRRKRTPDAIASICAGVTGLPVTSTASPETDYLTHEHGAAIERACAAIEAVIGVARYAAALDAANYERAPSSSGSGSGSQRVDALRAAEKRRGAIEVAKRAVFGQQQRNKQWQMKEPLDR